MNNDNNYYNAENTWDDRRPKMNRWWEMVENENEEVSNAMSTSLVAQQAAKQWIEHSTPSKRVIESKLNIRPTCSSSTKCLDLYKCRGIVPIASRPCGGRVSATTVKTSVYGLADAVCRLHDGWSVGPLADDQRLRCSLAALVRHLKRLIADVDCSADDECCDRLAVLIERYYGCRDEYRKVCARLHGLQRPATTK